MSVEPLIRNVSDTALWVAVYRAEETERPDALFRDPYARRLAGERGQKIRTEMGKWDWPMVVRTVVFDEVIAHAVRAGADTVINLAAGLDARPYRMHLPADLHWVEVDMPDMIDYKEEILRDERPRCRLTRIRQDLSDRPARQALFTELAAASKKCFIITEGLLIYLDESAVADFTDDLAAHKSFYNWITDLASPSLLRLLHKEYADLNINSPMKFAPANGTRFFEQHGWRAIHVRSAMKEAARLKRLGWFYRLIARLPDNPAKPGKQPWSGFVLLEQIA